MSSLTLSSSYVDVYLASKNVILPISLPEAHESLQDKTCLGADFLGWIDLPQNIHKSLSDIQETADALRVQSDVLMVCGIGGSYL
jgi:glucose-6-phosphate isomerase